MDKQWKNEKWTMDKEKEERQEIVRQIYFEEKRVPTGCGIYRFIVSVSWLGRWLKCKPTNTTFEQNWTWVTRN